MFEIEGKYNKAKVFAETVENECISQITDLCNQEWLKGCQIAIMPDTHAGKGCTIGTTIAINDKVCPSLVGVDIGCGMLAIEIPNEFVLNLEHVDNYIINNIPNGFEVNNKILYDENSFKLEDLRCYKQLKNPEYLKKSVGSLGGGNHFIEINRGKHGYYLVVHTGSRNLGKQVAEYYQDVSDEYCNHSIKGHQQARQSLISQLKLEGKAKEISKRLSDFDNNYQHSQKIPHDLCYLEGDDAKEYLHDVKLCSRFASMNRSYIAKRILNFIAIDNGFDEKTLKTLIAYDGPHLFELAIFDGKDNHVHNTLGFETIHNYIGDDNILRKGAISAKQVEKVLIPINMKDGSLICIGKGNSNYNYSGPHGAGRLMSRSAAKNKVSLEEFKESMEGIYTSSVCQSTVDEAPMVYKSIDEVINNIDETAEIVEIIKPIYNFKAH